MAGKLGNNQGIIMNGNAKIDAHNLAVGNRANIEVRNELGVRKELARLKDEIQALPETHAQEKEDLETFRSALEAEAAKPEPRKSYWDVNAKGLVEAAKAVAGIAPEVLKTAQLLASWFTGTL